MSLVIGVICSDGLVVAADGQVITHHPSDTGAAKGKKIIHLAPYNKLYAFSCDTTAGLDKITPSLTAYCQGNNHFADPSFARDISQIMQPVCSELPSKLGLEILVAEFEPPNEPYISTYEITNSGVKPHSYAQNIGKHLGLYPIGYKPAYKIVEQIISSWRSFPEQNTVLEMIPGVYKAMYKAISDHHSILGHPICLYKIDKDGVVDVSAEIPRFEQCLKEHPANPDPFLCQCLLPQPIPVSTPLSPIVYQLSDKQVLRQLSPQTNRLLKRKKSKSQKEQVRLKQQIKAERIQRFFEKGVLQYEMGKYQESLAAFEEVLKITRQVNKAWYNKGLTLQKLGRHQEALASYDRAISLDPNDADAYNNRGTVYHDLKEYDKALTDFNKAISLEPRLAPPWYNRACVYARLGNKTEAIKDLARAIRLDRRYKEMAKRDEAFQDLWPDEGFKRLTG